MRKGTFITIFRSLNTAMQVTFKNTHVRGIISRTDKRGKFYYTDDGRRWETLKEAIQHRNNHPKLSFN